MRKVAGVGTSCCFGGALIGWQDRLDQIRCLPGPASRELEQRRVLGQSGTDAKRLDDLAIDADVAKYITESELPVPQKMEQAQHYLTVMRRPWYDGPHRLRGYATCEPFLKECKDLMHRVPRYTG
jgi:hypothetical protein